MKELERSAVIILIAAIMLFHLTACDTDSVTSCTEDNDLIRTQAAEDIPTVSYPSGEFTGITKTTDSSVPKNNTTVPDKDGSNTSSSSLIVKPTQPTNISTATSRPTEPAINNKVPTDYFSSAYGNRPQPKEEPSEYIFFWGRKPSEIDNKLYRVSADGTVVKLGAINEEGIAVYGRIVQYKDRIYLMVHNALYSYDLDGNDRKVISQRVIDINMDNSFIQVCASYMGWLIVSRTVPQPPYADGEPQIYAVRLTDGKAFLLREANVISPFSFTEFYAGCDRGYVFYYFGYIKGEEGEQYMTGYSRWYVIDLMSETPEMLPADKLMLGFSPYCGVYKNYIYNYDTIKWQNGTAVAVDKPENSGELNLTNDHTVYMISDVDENNHPFRHVRVCDAKSGKVLFSKDIGGISIGLQYANDAVGFLMDGPFIHQGSRPGYNTSYLVNWDGTLHDLNMIIS